MGMDIFDMVGETVQEQIDFFQRRAPKMYSNQMGRKTDCLVV